MGLFRNLLMQRKRDEITQIPERTQKRIYRKFDRKRSEMTRSYMREQLQNVRVAPGEDGYGVAMRALVALDDKGRIRQAEKGAAKRAKRHLAKKYHISMQAMGQIVEEAERRGWSQRAEGISSKAAKNLMGLGIAGLIPFYLFSTGVDQFGQLVLRGRDNPYIVAGNAAYLACCVCLHAFGCRAYVKTKGYHAALGWGLGIFPLFGTVIASLLKRKN